MKTLKILSTLTITCYSAVSFGHGFVDISRAKFCEEQKNNGCGAIIYEPQSLEAQDGFPQAGPADGQIASAGISRFSALNEQTPSRWFKNKLQSGNNSFTWTFRATHPTRDYKYYITKPNWNSAQALTRDSFDLNPFCTAPGGTPFTGLTHDCVIPERNGYNIILAVWDVGDTANSFYNVIDVDMSSDGSTGGGNPDPSPTWTDIGDIPQGNNLLAGDTAILRLFNTSGEIISDRIEMTITSNEAGQENIWQRNFAEFISNQSDLLSAGILNSAGTITPTLGKNDVFVHQSGNYTRAEIDIRKDQGALLQPNITVNVSSTEFKDDAPVNLDFTVSTNQELEVSAQLYKDDIRVGLVTSTHEGSRVLNIQHANPSIGEYNLVVIAKRVSDGVMTQQTVKITVTTADGGETGGDNGSDGNGDGGSENTSTYPEGHGSYTTTTKIKALDGNTYQCLVPNWCNGSKTYYSPGTGLAWSSAWIKTSDGTPVSTIAAEHVYPQGRGNYDGATIVSDSDGNNYRCLITSWCNHPSNFYFAPGTGLAWSSAWEKL